MSATPPGRVPLLAAATAVTLAAGLAGCDVQDVEEIGCPGCQSGFSLPPLETAGPTPPPLLGGSLAIDGDIAVAGDPDRDRVLVVDLADDTLIAEHRAGQPGRVVIGDGRAYVTLRTEGVLLVLDLDDGRVRARHPVCAAPRGVALAWDQVHVACAGGALVSLDRDGDIIRRLPLAPDLRDVVVAGGRLHVSRFRQPELITVNRHGAVLARRAPETVGVADSDQPSAPTVAWRTIALPSGMIVMLHQRARLSPVPTDAPGGYGGGFGGCGTGIVTPELTAFTSVILDRPPRSLGALPEMTMAIDLAWIGGRLAVAAPGDRDPFALRTAYVDVDLDDPESWGPCAFTSGALARPNDPRDHIALAEHRGDLIGLRLQPARLSDIDGNPRVELGGEPVLDPGRMLFHADVGAGVACASCHPEGSEDGHPWRFEGIAGIRRTQELRGGLAGTAPFHWGGELRDMQHLMDEVMTHRMGGPLMPAEYTAAMVAWLDALPVERVDIIAPGDPVAGGVIFEDATVGCAGCHSGPRYADDLHYDVGTGGEFVTPTLLGIGRRGSLMHDGCGETLADRFEPGCGGGEAHGRTAHLTEGELDDLIAYLETL